MFLLVSVAALICAVGLVVDAGGRMYAADDARYAAEQAARAAGQEIDAAQLRASSTGGVVETRARVAAQEVLAALDADGTVSVSADQVVTVTVRDTYQPKFLLFLGTMSVEESSSARPTVG